MALKMRNQKVLLQYILKRSNLIKAGLIYGLAAMVADLQNHAKLSAGYDDQTSNLKSSIGGVVLQDGKPVSYAGFVKEGSADSGDKEGSAFLEEVIAAQSRSGFTIILVAGMEYATYVENNYELNVLKSTELKMQKDLERFIKNFKRKIDTLNTDALYIA